MSKFFFLVILATFLWACNNAAEKATRKIPKIDIEPPTVVDTKPKNRESSHVSSPLWVIFSESTMDVDSFKPETVKVYKKTPKTDSSGTFNYEVVPLAAGTNGLFYDEKEKSLMIKTAQFLEENTWYQVELLASGDIGIKDRERNILEPNNSHGFYSWEFVATRAGVGSSSGPTYTLGGEIHGMSGADTLVLQNNGGDDHIVSANGAFYFPTTLAEGSSYKVTIKTPPAGKRCVVRQETGVIPTSDVTSVIVQCGTTENLDTSFGVEGKISTSLGSVLDYNCTMAMQDDGKILVAGSALNIANYDFALARYHPDGNLDTAFGIGGKRITPIGTGDNMDYARAMVMQTDQKIILAGDTVNGTSRDFALVRYLPDGSLDINFGVEGKRTTPIGSSGKAYTTAIAIQNEGKILVAGYLFHSTASDDFVLAQYDPNGSLDTNFGADRNGIVITPIGGAAMAMAMQSGGKIVVAGYALNKMNATQDFALVQYNLNGSLDTNFGADRTGIVLTPIGNSADYAHALVIQPDGKILVAGKTYNGTKYDFALARYFPNGSLDTDFGVSGKVVTSVGSGADSATAIAIQRDGRIVVGGTSFNGVSYDFVLVRYDALGKLENTFGVENTGKIIASLGSAAYDACTMAMQSDERIVVAGRVRIGTTNGFALARYWP